MWVLTIESENGMDRNDFLTYQDALNCLNRAKAADWYGGDEPTHTTIVKEG